MSKTDIDIRKIPVRISSTRAWSVSIGAGIVGKLDEIFDFQPCSALVIIADENTDKLYGEQVAGILRRTGKKMLRFSIPAGENSKSLEEAGRGYRFLMDNGIDRRAMLCLLGGGVVGDLGGYIAATYLRGIDYIQLPTTLLAQVDAGIGGKVGVNFGGKKNIIGSFYQPKAVIIDTSLLKTLLPAEMRNGFAEIIKYALAMDAKLLRQLQAKEDAEFNPQELTAIIERCVRLKLRIVKADETERTGKRAILNFGHTVAHAIEAISGMTDRHGEAVAIGMVAAARLSERIGMLNKRNILQIESLLTHFGLPTRYQGMSPEKIMEAIRFDKKVADGQIKWVLLEGVGRGVVNCTVEDSLVKEVLGEIRQ